MRILIADDDPITRRLLETYLTRWGYELVLSAHGSEALEVLEGEQAPELAILDWMMPGLDGIDICRRVRRSAGRNYTYIILLTARSGKEDVVEGLEAGADDYMIKPFEPNELKVRVRAGARILQLQADLRAALDQTKLQASRDPLTRLWNRGAIMEIMEQEFARMKRLGSHVGVILADIDHFKQVNDRFGHFAGDAVLRAVSAKMSAMVRPYDAVGRYGGEEFLIVVPGCDVKAASDVAERIRRALNDEPLSTPEGAFSVTASLGVASAGGAAATASSEIVRAADQALYRAKNSGRNRVEKADPRRETTNNADNQSGTAAA